MHLIIITNKLKDGDVESAGEGHAILSHAYSVILDVRAPGITVTVYDVRAVYPFVCFRVCSPRLNFCAVFILS